jgi:hypothetical protein
MPKNIYAMPSYRIPAAVLLLAALFLGGCAKTRMELIAPRLDNMTTARQYLGEPTRSGELPDGTMRHEWLLDRMFTYPGGFETRETYMGHDRDGFRVYAREEVFVQARQERQYCRAEAVADRDGRITGFSWEGRHCDELLRVKASGQ